jgi:hypothetical protein
MTATPTVIPTAWNVLHQALDQRRAVRAVYHDRLRVICPHALGWKNGRAKALVYQTAILGPHTHEPRGWRSLFIDDIHDVALSDDPWNSAANYTPHTTGIDTLAVAIT